MIKKIGSYFDDGNLFSFEFCQIIDMVMKYSDFHMQDELSAPYHKNEISSKGIQLF